MTTPEPLPEVGQFRIARDIGGERARFEDIEIGCELGTLHLTFTQDDVENVCARYESRHPWYSVNSPFGGTIVPIANTFSVGRRLLSDRYNVVGLFYRWSFECEHPLRVGVEYAYHAHVSDKWIKNDREYVAYDVVCRDPADAVMFSSRRVHVLDYLKRTVPKIAEGGLETRPAASSGAGKVRTAPPGLNVVTDSAAVEVAPLATRDTGLGAWLPSFAKATTEDVLDREVHRDPGGRSHHNHDAARLEGLPKRFAGGPGIMELVHRAALSFFGRGWVEGGRADLTMVRPVFVDEFVYSKARVTSLEPLEDGSTRLVCEAWVENQNEEKKVVGTVSGIVR